MMGAYEKDPRRLVLQVCVLRREYPVLESYAYKELWSFKNPPRNKISWQVCQVFCRCGGCWSGLYPAIERISKVVPPRIVRGIYP